MKNSRAIREGGERLKAEVNPGYLSSRRQGLYRRLSARETDVPTVCFPADGDGLDRSLCRATPTDGDTPNLGEDQEPILQGRAVAILLVSERVVASARLVA